MKREKNGWWVNVNEWSERREEVKLLLTEIDVLGFFTVDECVGYEVFDEEFWNHRIEFVVSSVFLFFCLSL